MSVWPYYFRDHTCQLRASSYDTHLKKADQCILLKIIFWISYSL